MFELNNLAESGSFFLVIAGELVLLFVGVTFLVGLPQEFIPPETIQRVLTDRISSILYFKKILEAKRGKQLWRSILRGG